MKHIVFVLQEIILEIGIKKVETKITITKHKQKTNMKLGKYLQHKYVFKHQM